MALRPRTLLLAACWCAVAFLVLLAVAYGSHEARSLDARALHGFIDLQAQDGESRTYRIAMLGNPAQIGVMALALALIALARGRPRISIAVIGLLAATSVSSQVLKAVLAYPRYDGVVDGAHVDPAAFPSGHATAAMSIALAGILVAPPRARPFAAVLGTAFALSMGFCIVSLGWHFPSDVVGGFLLATVWTLVIAAALRAAAERWPERTGRTHVTAAFQRGVDAVATIGAAALAVGLVLGAGLVATTILVSHPSAVVDFAAEHTAIVAVGAAIALAAAVLLAGVTAALRRS
ncbi:MAG TPA: phosphatase PAP2 family protein [Thermoleophilaceae bacterium]|nr:phosphatase PAP2 family protein [Thermoleophilaceae bacterium]